MVRYAGMSKGCETCRKRKIKCDEKLPSCTQCARGKRNCPGAVGGNIFLVIGPNKPRKHLRDYVPQSPTKSPSAPSKTSRERKELSMGTWVGTANEDVEQLLSLFIAFFGRSPDGLKRVRRRGWMDDLPSMISSSPKIDVRCLIMAPVLALHSKLSRNQDLEVAARKYYGYGLTHQRNELMHISCTTKQASPSAADITTAVMLAYYEVISSTSGNGFFQHMLGAMAMLEMIGPSACKTGIMHQLFTTVRIHMVYIVIATRSQTVLASEDWTTIPFSSATKSPRDRIFDLLMQFPKLQQQSNYLGLTHESPQEPFVPFIESLHVIWTDMQQLDQLTPHLPYIASTSAKFNDMDFLNYIPSYVASDPESAITLAFYSVAWILSLVELERFSPEGQCYGQLINTHCGVILRQAICVEKNQDGCGLIRMAFPLKSVMLFSSDMLQKESAMYRLELWRLKKGLGGIWNVATRAEGRISKAYELYTSR